jgi:hypothetical protein
MDEVCQAVVDVFSDYAAAFHNASTNSKHGDQNNDTNMS